MTECKLEHWLEDRIEPIVNSEELEARICWGNDPVVIEISLPDEGNLHKSISIPLNDLLEEIKKGD